MPEDRHSGTPGGNGSGADVKSGSVVADDGTSGFIYFTTDFTSVPDVVASLTHATVGVTDIVILRNVQVGQFNYYIHKGHGGASHTWTVHWIATDAGDP